jgi:hypothetical protein
MLEKQRMKKANRLKRARAKALPATIGPVAALPESMTLTLHIGAAKTGTTSIQRFLQINRQALSEQDILFPKTFGDSNQTLLPAYVNPEQHRFHKRQAANKPKLEGAYIEKYRNKLEDGFRAELAAGGCHKVIMSNEHCHIKLIEKQQVQMLAGLFARFFEKTRIIFYVRRQDRLAMSRYSTALKGGFVPNFGFPDLKKNGKLWHFYDFLAVYNTWAEVLGADNVKLCVFDKSRFIDNDLISDFCAHAGIQKEGLQTQLDVLNKSLGVEAEIIVRELNSRALREEITQVERKKAVAWVVANFAGQKRLPTKSEAMAFYEQFQDDNVQLARLIGARDSTCGLFDSNFDEYPDSRDVEAEKSIEYMAARYVDLL